MKSKLLGPSPTGNDRRPLESVHSCSGLTPPTTGIERASERQTVRCDEDTTVRSARQTVDT
ncbi:hypothetical protein D8S78_11375 [Natrialba swarupiae]|nr:hypothetical protein [Natrialba swarupiae]